LLIVISHIGCGTGRLSRAVLRQANVYAMVRRGTAMARNSAITACAQRTAYFTNSGTLEKGRCHGKPRLNS
jgi:hypothetical protein